MLQQAITRQADSDFVVEVINDHARFTALQTAWQSLEQRDPEATFFLSWAWMAEAFRDTLHQWSVIVVRSAAAPEHLVCVLPLKARVHWSTTRRAFQTELQAGGRLLWSEYTGFLCDPAMEKGGLIAAANQLAQMPWVRLSMRYIAQTRRCRIFTDALAARGVSIKFKDYMINRGETNNLLCPQVALPQDFDTFMKTSISRNKRQQYNRFKRQFLDSGDYSIGIADAATLNADLDALLGLWKAKWRAEKGSTRAASVAETYRGILTAAHRVGALMLPVIRRGDRPLGALGHIVDHDRKSVHFIIVGRDELADEPFVGTALHFFSIDWAIKNGMGLYDFGHGNEPYKYGYGTQDREVLYFEARRTAPAQENLLDPQCTGMVLRRIEAFIAAGETDFAARGCAQLRGLF